MVSSIVSFYVDAESLQALLAVAHVHESWFTRQIYEIIHTTPNFSPFFCFILSKGECWVNVGLEAPYTPQLLKCEVCNPE